MVLFSMTMRRFPLKKSWDDFGSSFRATTLIAPSSDLQGE